MRTVEQEEHPLNKITRERRPREKVGYALLGIAPLAMLMAQHKATTCIDPRLITCVVRVAPCSSIAFIARVSGLKHINDCAFVRVVFSRRRKAIETQPIGVVR